MDKTIVILLIILLIVFGIFFISMIGSSNSGSVGPGSYSGPQQYSGGGCGR